MAILNYTTSIDADKTAAEIQKRLVKAKAAAVLNEYDNAGILSNISFRMDTAHGVVHFRLPANVEGVYRAMQRDGKVPKRFQTREQAARVAWRICKDWVEAQLALVEAEMAALPEVFLPYAQTSNGKTVYECFEKRGLAALTFEGNAA